MKGLACGICHDIRTLDPMPGNWVTCRCGNMTAHWLNPFTGKAEFWANDKSKAFGVGFHNGFLGPALEGKLLMHQDARAQHELATTAPGYVFDKSCAGCWVVIYKPGGTSDTSWAEKDPRVP